MSIVKKLPKFGVYIVNNLMNLMHQLGSTCVVYYHDNCELTHNMYVTR